MKPIAHVFALTAILLTAAGAIQAANYTFTTLTYPGAIDTYPISVNNAGTIVGYYFDSSYTGHGFTYVNGVYASVEAGSNCYSTFVTGINNNGDLTGYCFANAGGVISFLVKKGVFTFFKVPGILDSYSEAINDKDVTVGFYFSPSVTPFAALNGSTHTVPISGQAALYGINNSNVAVGSYGGPNLGLIHQNGSTTTYQYPGSYETFFNGVNNKLQIVGDENKVARGPVTAFLYVNGVYTDILVPNAATSVANGINDLGAIVGSYTNAAGVFFGFLAVPQ